MWPEIRRTNVSSHRNMLRKLSDWETMDQAINNYGCWCYFDSHNKAKGPVFDVYDEFCRDLHKAYECAIMDAEDEGDTTCVPWEVDYVATTGWPISSR